MAEVAAKLAELSLIATEAQVRKTAFAIRVVGADFRLGSIASV
jgi:hypothetical protein